MTTAKEILGGVIKNTKLTKTKAELAIVVARRNVLNDLYDLSIQYNDIIQLLDNYQDKLYEVDNPNALHSKINLENTANIPIVHLYKMPEEVSNFVIDYKSKGNFKTIDYIEYTTGDSSAEYGFKTELDKWLGDIPKILIIGL